MSRVATECDQVKTSASLQHYWDDADDATLRKMWGSASISDIARRLNRSFGAVQRRARVLALPPLRRRRFNEPRPVRPAPLALMLADRPDSPHRQPSLPKLKFMEGEV